MLQAALSSGYHAQLPTSAPGFDSRLGCECVMQYAGTGKDMHEAVTKIGANRNWQCQLPTQIGSNQTANLKVAVVIFHNFLCAIIQA